MYGSRKYPHPHHRGNWKFQRGGGFKSPGNSRGVGEGGRANGHINFQMVQFDSGPTYLLENCHLLTLVECSEFERGLQRVCEWFAKSGENNCITFSTVNA